MQQPHPENPHKTHPSDVLVQHHVVEDGEKHDVNILEYIDLVRKHYKMIAAAGVLCALIGWGLFQSKEPLYRASARLNLYPISQDSLDFTDTRQTSFLKMYFRTEIINTEFEIMKSEQVVAMVADALGGDYFEKNLPQKSKRGLFRHLKDWAVGRSPEPAQPEPVGEIEPGDAIAKKRAMRGQLLGNVRIREVRDTNLVEISYISRSPKAAQEVANAWAQAYIRFGLEQSVKNAKQSRKFLQEQLDSLHVETEKLVGDKNDLEQRYDIVKLGANSSVEDDTVARVNQSLLQAETELFKLEAKRGKLRSASPDDAAEVNQSPLVSAQVQGLTEKRAEYRRKLETYQVRMPMMQSLKKEVDSLAVDLENTRRQVYNGLLADLNGEIAAQQGTVDRLRKSLKARKDTSFEVRSGLERQIRSIEDQIEGNRKMISDLSYRLKGYGLALDMKEIGRTDKDIVELARRPGGPFAPSLKKYVGVGLLLGLLLSAGYIFLVEVTDRRIHDEDAFEKLTGLPILAKVPRIREKTLQRTIADYKIFALEETRRRVKALASKFPNLREWSQIEAIVEKALRDHETGSADNERRKRSEDLKPEALYALSEALDRIVRFLKRAQHGLRHAELAELRGLCRYASMIGIITHAATEPAEENAPRRRRRRNPVKALMSNKSRRRGPSFQLFSRPQQDDDIAYGNTSDEPDFALRAVVGCYTHIRPQSPFSEIYRHLRTSIQLSGTKKQKVFLMTSSESGEGKTISSINLAIAFSQLDRKTLLIDGDLRRSRLHKVFKMRQTPGLVDCLAGQAELGACIRGTFVPNLDILCSGNQTPLPAELLDSEEMVSLMATLRQRYDFIIIDTAPVLPVTDACIIGRLVDGALFVGKAAKSKRDYVLDALRALRSNGIQPIGVLFNDIDHGKKIRYSKYGYGRGYGYGYGYGYGGDRYGYGYGYGAYYGKRGRS